MIKEGHEDQPDLFYKYPNDEIKSLLKKTNIISKHHYIIYIMENENINLKTQYKQVKKSLKKYIIYKK